MPHFFCENIVKDQESELPEEEARHALKVLRMKEGDELMLLDGKGQEARARLLNSRGRLMITEVQLHKPLRPYYLHVAFAPAKNAERNEWFIEKAIETGVDRISFLHCEHSERSRINLERCQKIAISAMKQSKQYYLPQLDDVQNFSKFIQEPPKGLGMIATCLAPAHNSLQKQMQEWAPHNEKHFLVLIGPEGDFSPKESSQAIQNNFRHISLGPGILRTETAALYVCMSARCLFT